MPREGPCCHCNAAVTVMWRAGPTGKPVLCNRCGIRWSLKKKLPKLAVSETTGVRVAKRWRRVPARKPVLCNRDGLRRRNTRKLPKLSVSATTANVEEEVMVMRAKEDEAGPVQMSSAQEEGRIVQAEDGKGSNKGDAGTSWHTGFPKRKRSVLQQPKVSFVEDFRRQLLDVLQQPEFSHLASEPEGELIYFDNHDPSGEIGLGCVLLPPDYSEK